MTNKPGNVLVSYAEGFSRIFDSAMQNGIYVDDLMAHLLFTFSEGMINAKNLTLADRQAIKEYLEPYVHKIPMLPVNKLCTEQEVKLCYEIPREVILHPEKFDKGYHTQSKWNGEGTLLEILQQNNNTDYGRRYFFDGLQSAEGYQIRVPMSSYNTYAPLIKLQTQIGEHDIFSADPVKYYLLSEDEKGDTLLFPATQKHLEPYVRAFTDIVRDKTSFTLFESLPKPRAYNDRGVLNSLSGVILSEFFWQERNTLQGSHAKFAAPEELFFPTEALDTLYLRVLFALKERAVEQIISPSRWGIAEALTFIEKNWEIICNDIERGEITFVMDVSTELLRRMKGHLSGDKERADQLRNAFSAGFDSKVLSRVWPNLNKIIAFGDDSFCVYTDTLRKYTGDILLDNGYLMTSEALIGRSIEGSNNYRLLEGNNFYEFLPVTAAIGEKPLLLTNLNEGEIYELIITNRAGLYRYRTGYLIRVEEQNGGNLIFSLSGHRGQSINIDGAELDENNIYQAIFKTADKYGFEVADFAYDAGLTILIEPMNLTELSKILQCTSAEVIADSIDTFLHKENNKYNSHCKILWNMPQTHLLYRDLRRYREQSAPYQIKPTHFLNTPEKIKFFAKNIWRE